MPSRPRSSSPLHPFDVSPLQIRRERVFLLLAGVFLGVMAMLNILGITKFIHLGPWQIAVGVLPYPLTFLCTDLISELYGRARANAVVWTGLAVNVLLLGTIWLADRAEPISFRTPLQRIVTLDVVDVVDAEGRPVVDPATGYHLARPALPERGEDGEPQRDPRGRIQLIPVTDVALEPLPGAVPGAERLVDAASGTPLLREETLFGRLAQATRQALLASMVAYLLAQLVDVWLFHFWKRLSGGRHLWLRNNGSTVVSQLLDTICVVSITFGASLWSGAMSGEQFFRLVRDGYSFKLCVALLDTLPCYAAVWFLRRYLAAPSPAASASSTSPPASDEV